MPYATGGTFFDADSHIMELPDFLHRHADDWVLDALPPLSTASGGAQGEGAALYAATKRHSSEQIAVLEQNVIGGPKAYEALGAFDPSERAYALDLLGFHAQLVFGSFALASFLHHDDMRVRYGGCRAFNRAIAEFCADDARLLPVAVVSLADPVAALSEIDIALALGCAAVWIPAEPCGGRSPGHNDLDPIWARLADANIPFMLHVGAQPIEIRDEYMNTGRPPAPGWAGGGEALRLKDFPLLHQSSEEFLSVLVLDGVLERHPRLRGGVIELGATWVPGMLRRLDHAVDNLAKFAPDVRSFTRAPSRQVRDQLAFTPFSFEDVAALIDESADDLYLFSSDYPHVEGGRNPLGRFRKSLESASESTEHRFYYENFLRILPQAQSLLP